MPPDDSINPYAPPEATSLVASGLDSKPPRRPRSVKWATFVLTFFFLTQVWLYWQTISAVGVQKVWQAQSFLDPLLLVPLGFVFSWLGGRSKIAYYVNSGVLAMIVIKACWTTFLLIRYTPHAFSNVFLPQRCIEGLMICLFGYLFYRFTFGLPSRRYFGLCEDAPAASV